jgi:hypothetical protein
VCARWLLIQRRLILTSTRKAYRTSTTVLPENSHRLPRYENIVVTCTPVRLAEDRHQITITARKFDYFAPRLNLILDRERELSMAFRTNYRFERTERDRAKQAKKEEKLKKRQKRSELSSTPEAVEQPDEPARSDE